MYHFRLSFVFWLNSMNDCLALNAFSSLFYQICTLRLLNVPCKTRPTVSPRNCLIHHVRRSSRSSVFIFSCVFANVAMRKCFQTRRFPEIYSQSSWTFRHLQRRILRSWLGLCSLSLSRLSKSIRRLQEAILICLIRRDTARKRKWTQTGDLSRVGNWIERPLSSVCSL